MRSGTVVIMVLALVGGVVLVPDEASAIPAFARKHNLACSSCHTAWGYLNSTGRTYKEAGYILPDEDGEIDFETQPSQRVSDDLVLEKYFPVAARLKGYLYDKRKGRDSKIRPLHEVEILTAGNFWKRGSWFIELEGEDEVEFETEIVGSFAWHFDRRANFEVGFGGLLQSDPYNSTKDGGHRLTVSHKIPLDVGGGTASKFRGDTQFINFYGRSGDFYYLAGFSAGNANPEGENPKDLVLRAAYDFTPDLMLGGLYFDGQHEVGGLDVDLSRWGFDFNLSFSDLYLVGLWMNVEEDYGGGVSQTNDTGYIEAFYTVKRGSRPFFLPLVRYGFTELNDGADKLAAITAQIGFYVIENARIALEYSEDVDTPPGQAKSDRITLLADLVF